MKTAEDDLESSREDDRAVSGKNGKADNKGRILFLLELLRRETDEEHPLSTQEILEQVRAAGYSANRKTVRDDIKSGAPSRTGKYAASWTVKTEKETSTSLELVVHSKNKYQLAHLLEFGHAKRGGGRVAARPHIAAAEQHGMEELENAIERSLSHG